MGIYYIKLDGGITVLHSHIYIYLFILSFGMIIADKKVLELN